VRYCPDRDFPPYAFLPGRDPHPTRDPEGHSFGEEAPAAYLEPERWRENADYRFGVDLYNHGFLWEAHEAWEGLWHAAKKDEVQALHLQGLIQCAAACLKIPMEQPRGLERLSELGAEKLRRVARESGGAYMGIDLDGFVDELEAFARSHPTSIDGRPHIELAL
jgi:hypothetical protein